MQKFGFTDSVLDVANAVLEGKKLPRQLKDKDKETMMGYEYKPGKVRNQVVDKKDVKDKEKKGYIHTEEVDEDDIAEAMEVHLKPHPNGTHYTVHKVGKKLAAHGGIKVGERLSDTEVDDAKDSGIRVRHVKEDTDVKEAIVPVAKSPTRSPARDAGIVKKPVKKPMSSPVKEGAMKRMATQAQLGEPGSGLEGFKKRNAAKNNGGVAQGSSVNQDKPSNMGNLGKKQKSVPQNGSVNQNEEVIDEKKLDPVDHKALKGSHAQRKDKDIDNDGKVDDTDTYLHHRRKTVKKAMKEAEEMKVKKCEDTDALGGKKLDPSKGVATVSEAAGEEKTQSSAQGAQLAKHYYMMAKRAQQGGNKEAAGKYMSVAKKFYRKSESDQAKEKSGHAKGAAEGFEPEDLGRAQTYFSEIELEEILAAEEIVTETFRRGETSHDGWKPLKKGVKTKSGKYAGKRKSDGSMPGESARSGQRVTKTEKEGPEHIVMQARKVVSLGHKHGGVEFADGSKAKVHPDHARAALSRYEKAKPAEKTEMQKHMNHSHGGFKHVASGKPLDHEDNPAHKKTDSLSAKIKSTARRTDRAVNKMKHPLDA